MWYISPLIADGSPILACGWMFVCDWSVGETWVGGERLGLRRATAGSLCSCRLGWDTFAFGILYVLRSVETGFVVWGSYGSVVAREGSRAINKWGMMFCINW